MPDTLDPTAARPPPGHRQSRLLLCAGLRGKHLARRVASVADADLGPFRQICGGDQRGSRRRRRTLTEPAALGSTLLHDGSRAEAIVVGQVKHRPGQVGGERRREQRRSRGGAAGNVRRAGACQRRATHSSMGVGLPSESVTITEREMARATAAVYASMEKTLSGKKTGELSKTFSLSHA